jgi:organic radical activating enzyme
MTFNTAKIVVTWDCNLSCGYCCNADPLLRATFKPITVTELRNLPHTDFEITGGEPLKPDQLFRTLRVLNGLPAERDVYLYTNGMYVPNSRSAITYGTMLKRHGVTGINVGYHRLPLDWRALRVVNWVVPIRLYVRESDYDAYIKRVIQDCNFTERIWKPGECNNIITDRFIIT